MNPSLDRRDRSSWPWLAIGLWLAASLLFLALRPLLPVDETRAVAVAWEMRTGGNWLVPHLNGEIYPEKPPLLAWLVNLAWGLFGVSDAAARLVPAVLGVAALVLTGSVARRLAPERGGETGQAAALVLVAMPLWLVWGNVVVYDLPLATATVAAHAMGLAFAAGGPLGWMVGAGMALGAGILFKGPVILAHVLPAWLAWAWWRPEHGTSPGRWALGTSLAVLIGAGIGLAWALSAAAIGGEAYGNTLIVDQTVQRLGEQAHHARAWWWYLPVVPLVTLPWTLRPGVWGGLVQGLGGRPAPGASRRGWRYLAVWLGGGLLILSAAGGKQPHYLMPLLPGVAIAIALALQAPGRSPALRDTWLPALGLMAIAGLIAFGPEICANQADARACAALARSWGLVPLAGAALVAGLAVAGRTTVTALAVAWIGSVLALTAWAGPILDRQDTTRMARAIGAVQAAGGEVAQLGRYNGQYHFEGRLTKPVIWFETPAELSSWVVDHPDQHILVYTDVPPGEAGTGAVLVSPYRSHEAVLWSAHDAVAAGVLGSPRNPERWGSGAQATD